MAQTKQLKIMRVEDFAGIARLKSPRNVRIWGRKGWINIITYEDKQYVVMDEKGSNMLKVRSELPVGGSSRLLWKKPARSRLVPQGLLFKPQSDPDYQKRYGKLRLLTIPSLEKYFRCTNQGLTQKHVAHLDEVSPWRGQRLFTAESAEARQEV